MGVSVWRSNIRRGRRVAHRKPPCLTLRRGRVLVECWSGAVARRLKRLAGSRTACDVIATTPPPRCHLRMIKPGCAWVGTTKIQHPRKGRRAAHRKSPASRSGGVDYRQEQVATQSRIRVSLAESSWRRWVEWCWCCGFATQEVESLSQIPTIHTYTNQNQVKRGPRPQP